MNKSVTRIVAVFLIVVCIAALLPTVQASDTVTIDHEYSKYIGKTWFNWYTQYAGYPVNMVFSTGEYWTETMAYFTTTDGRIAFCLEPSVTGTTGSFSNTGWGVVDPYKRQGIALAIAYGAPNNGDTSETGLLATAAVVWDMACGYRDYLGQFMLDGDHSAYITSSPFSAALQAYFPAAYAEYNSILARIAKHGTVPSFSVKRRLDLASANTIVLKYDAASGTYKASVTDTNGVLESFNFVSPINGLTFAKEGNTLKITATEAAAAQLDTATTICNRGNEIEVSEDLCTVWYPSGGGQKVCTLDAPTDPVPCYFKLEAEATTGSLRFVKKTNTGAGLSGWYFDLYRDAACTDKIGTYGPTKGDGTYTITGLEPGTYYVKEVDESALYPYWDYDTTVHEVVIAVGVTSDVTVTNTHNGKLLIRKTVTDGGRLDGWQFKVTRLSDNADMGVFTTQADGTILSGNLLPGDYLVEEILPADSPYYCEGENPVTVTVEAGKTAEVSFSNAPRMGTITVNKTGEIFASVTETDGIYQPVYQARPLGGAVFEIRAAEDIYTPGGTLAHAAGALVDTVTTDASGSATSKPLYMGKYAVSEVTAPGGMVLDTQPRFVTLAYPETDGQHSSGNVNISNNRQRARITLEKVMERDGLNGIQGDVTAVTFGLYAAEKMTAADGKTIPADGLLETAACGADGKLTFATDIPVWAKLYAREIATDGRYVLSDQKYPVEFTYAGQDMALVEISVNDGKPITNDLIRGTIIGKKVDEDGFAICGAKFGLFRQYETEFTAETALLTATSNEIGVFGFENVPHGSYIVRELEPAPGFLLNETLYDVTVDTDGETVEITVENAFLVGSVQVMKVDAENTETRLSGAVFAVYVDVDGDQAFDADIDILVGTMPEVQTGTYCMDNLRYGGYFIHEKTAPEGYLQDDGYYYFTIREDGEVVTVENKAGVGFVNTLIRGSVAGKKVDNTGKGLAGAVIGLFPADAKVFTTDAALMTAVSAEDGSFSFDEVPYGAYIVREIKAPEGYILTDKSYNITIHADGELIRVEIPNTPEPVVPTTGDTGSILLWFMLLTLSAAGTAVMLRVMQRRRGW